jgi:hypothetical protein
MTTDRHVAAYHHLEHILLGIYSAIMDGFYLGMLCPMWQATCMEHSQLDSCSGSQLVCE